MSDVCRAQRPISEIWAVRDHKVGGQSRTAHFQLKLLCCQQKTIQLTHLDVATEALQQPGSSLTLHSPWFLVCLGITVRVPLERYSRLWVGDHRVVFRNMIGDGGVVRRGHNEQDIWKERPVSIMYLLFSLITLRTYL